jgi:beta-mannosidase
MIRVWGGGIYEEEIFYEICDELGVMIWQDFMFACAAYPENKKFIDNVKSEIKHIVESLQYHPSIAIYCGNNENEWIWYRDNYISYKEMPGYKIFHQIIPPLIEKFDPYRPYWPSSPFGKDNDPNSVYSGNRHVWDIWSNWEDYTAVNNDFSLFVSEFGFQAPANFDTINQSIPKENRKVQDKLFEYHNKQIEGPERLFRFLAGHFIVSTKWEDFIYLTQLNQALALKTCIEHWRTNGVTKGSIIWQLNDCWPAISWSLVDSSINPKLSYYHVKKTFSKRIITIVLQNNFLKIFGLNEDKEFHGVLKIDICDLNTGNYFSNKTKKVHLTSASYCELESLQMLKLPEKKDWILIATLCDSDENIIHRNYYLKKKWKHIQLHKSKIKIQHHKKKGNDYLILSSDKPSFFVDLYHPEFKFSDRGIIILPNDNIKLNIIGDKNHSIKLNEIKVFSLNSILQD